MGVFDGLIRMDDNGNWINNQWIEWNHFLVPNKPQWFREILRNFVALLGHCMNCTSLDGCYLMQTNMPKQPLHENCDCQKKDITFSLVKSRAEATFDITKFTEYVFKNVIDSKVKNQIFYDLGFKSEDSAYLQREYCIQALDEYLKGNYKLKNLDKRGQRLAIPVKFKDTAFYSGWMLEPEGKIRNTTPFGGWIK